MKRMLLCLLCCAPLPGWAAEALPPGLMVLDGRPAPGLRLADADGKRTDLKELLGHWVMVHFWASWCGPCRAEMPSLQRLVESGKVPALKLVVVNTAEGDDEVAAFLNRHAPDLVTLMDRDGQVTERWQPRGLPSSFFVDPGRAGCAISPWAVGRGIRRPISNSCSSWPSPPQAFDGKAEFLPPAPSFPRESRVKSRAFRGPRGLDQPEDINSW